MIKKIALLFGVLFLLLGVLGFVPGATTTDASGMRLLFGLFMVDDTHNFIHILSGVAGLLAASSARYSRWYLQVFGIVYALVTLIGFIQGNTVLGLFSINASDNWLHVALAAGLLGSGFGIRDEDERDTATFGTDKSTL